MEYFNNFQDLAAFIIRSKKSEVRIANPTLWRLKLLVPLSIQSAGKKFSALRFETSVSSPEKMLDQILWQACFRGIQTFEWFVAFEIISRYILKLESCNRKLPFMLGILLESSPRGGTWFSNHPALRRGRVSTMMFDGEERKGESLLKRISTELGLTKPEKFVDLTPTLVEVSIPKPTELRFIGVGYKDKGSLGEPGVKPGDVPLSDYDFLFLSLSEELETKFTEKLREYHRLASLYKELKKV
jgi:hypothetical protein